MKKSIFFVIAVMILMAFTSCVALADDYEVIEATYDDYDSMWEVLGQVASDLGEKSSYQDMFDHYASDSINHQPTPGITAGQVDVLGSTYPTNVGNTDLVGQEITITFAKTENLSKEQMKDVLKERYGYTDEQLSDKNLDTIRTSFYEEVDHDTTFELKAYIDQNGVMQVKVPDDFDINSGLWRLDAMYVVINGQMVKFQAGSASATFVAFGKEAEVDVETIIENPPDTEDTKIRGSAGVEKKASTTPYDDMDPKVRGVISSTKNYDVETAVPTSEELLYRIDTKKSIFEITVKHYTVRAWVNTGNVTWYSTYETKEYNTKWDPNAVWYSTEYNSKTKKYESKKHKGDWVTYWTGRWIPAQATRSGRISGLQVTDEYYEVIKSNIYNALEGYDLAVQGTYQLRGNMSGFSATVNPGTKKIEIRLNEPTDTFSFCVRKSWKR